MIDFIDASKAGGPVVFLVERHIDYEGDNVLGVFSTREAAEEYAQKLADSETWGNADGWYVTKVDLFDSAAKAPEPDAR